MYIKIQEPQATASRAIPELAASAKTGELGSNSPPVASSQWGCTDVTATPPCDVLAPSRAF